MKHEITGTVIYEDLAGGFWGIKGSDGRQCLPVNMPNQLKVRGARVEITAIDSDSDGIFMWGTPIEIITFHTLPKP